jgi:hypothetical protein
LISNDPIAPLVLGLVKGSICPAQGRLFRISRCHMGQPNADGDGSGLVVVLKGRRLDDAAHALCGKEFALAPGQFKDKCLSQGEPVG